MAVNLSATDFVTDKALDFISSLEQVSDLEELIRNVRSVVGALGFDSFTFFEFSAPGSGLIEGAFPSEWTDRYKQHGYELDDPVFRQLRLKPAPFRWSEISPALMTSAMAKRILGEATEFGLEDGVTVPIQDLTGMRGILSFSGEHVDDDPRLFPALQLISFYAHAKYAELAHASSVDEIQLTEREIECLKWTSVGKTIWEIATILSIKEPTVRTHLEHARAKLHAANKAHAVAEAMRRNLLSP